MYGLRQANPIRRLVRVSAAWPPVSWLYARTLHHIDRAVYRLTRGRATFVSWVAGLPIVMLTTTGAKSGRRHTLPLVAVPEGDRLMVIASNYGQRRDPSWYHNLRAHPAATIAFEGAELQVTARELEGEERERHYIRGIEIYPGLSITGICRCAARVRYCFAHAGEVAVSRRARRLAKAMRTR